MTMGKFGLFTILFLIIYNFCFAQFNIGGRIEQKAKDRVNRKIDDSIDKSLDNVEDGFKKKTEEEESENKKNNKSKNNENSKSDNNAKNSNTESINKTETTKTSLKVDSKFDFVAGEKVVLFEDFSKDNVGDFPDKWNTNGSGEIITNNKTPGKFLKTNSQVTFYPEWLTSLPENFTAEFDLISSDDYSYYSGSFAIGITSEKNISSNWSDYARMASGSAVSDLVIIGFHPHDVSSSKGTSFLKSFHNQSVIIENTTDQNQFHIYDKTIAHISIWCQKQRIRVYVNDIKIWDLPKALFAGTKLNSLFFSNEGSGNEGEGYYISNLRVAVGAPDTRNKLITEGKFSTSGILFDTGSDKIKMESYGIIKEIATVLKENDGVKINIVGHTDSDGDDALNMTLSKKRSLAVKSVLAKELNVSESRIDTDGKGETQQLLPNSSSENKAQNRRVEFIKL